MTDNYPETANFGLTRVGEGESLQKDDFGVTDGNLVTIDRVLKVLADHDHTGGTKLADPAAAPGLAVSTSGGTLPAGQTYYYQVSYVDLFGLETAASPEVSVITPPPLDVPTAPSLSVEATGGTLGSGIYRYVLASRTTGGGITTTSDPAEITVETGTTNRILISLPDLPTGAEALQIYRSRPGQTQYFYWAQSLDGADLYDDGSVAEDQTILAPVDNTSAGTNSVTVTLAGGTVPAGVKMWRIYRTSSPGIYDGLNLVHEVSEGLTEEATEPRPDWVDDGSPMFRGQPRRTSTTTAPPPAVGAFAVPAGGTTGQVLAKIDATDYHTQWVDASGGGGSGGGTSSETARFTQEREWSVYAPGTLAIGKIYAAHPNDFIFDSGATQGQLILPRWMHAYFQTAPVVDANGAQVGFELVGGAPNFGINELPSRPNSFGFGGGSQNINRLGVLKGSVKIEAEDTPSLPSGRIVVDDTYAGSSSGLGKAARISAQNEYVDFAFDGTAAVGTIPVRPWLQVDTVYYIAVSVRCEDTSTPPSNDLRIIITDESGPTTLIQQDYTVLPMATSSGYYNIMLRITAPPSLYTTATYPRTVNVRVQKMLSTTVSYLVDDVTAIAAEVGVAGSRQDPIELRATLMDSPNFPLPAVAFPTGVHFVAPPRVYVREGIETSVSFDFWTDTFASVAWTVTSDQTWCVPTPASGTSATDTITAAVSTTGFAAGSRHVATLTLSASGYPNATVEVVALMAPAVLGADASVLVRYSNG